MVDCSPTRRSFVKGAGSLAAVAAAAGAVTSAGAFGRGDALASDASPSERVVWSRCNVNCGGGCWFQYHVVDGKIAYMESDNTGSADFQGRACLRGRAMRKWINHPDRLMYPMKRVGKRGEGKFERISWDEAIDSIASALKRVIDTYGNEAIYVNYGTGMYSVTGRTSNRLMNVLGGSLRSMFDYSAHMAEAAMPFMYGVSLNGSSMTECLENSDLLVMFGNSPAETRMGGGNIVWDFTRAREALKERGGKIVSIDPRLNESVSGHSDEWIPIRPGTDAALCSAIAHEWIVEGKVDKEFLDTYCVGFDEDTMPESARGMNRSYRDYIMGTGYDRVEKTPEWAAPITQVPADAIRRLAADIAAAKAPFITQGWGSQRHSNGEDTCRAICMLPLLIGKWGLPGTNSGEREGMPGALVKTIPNGENPVKASIPVYQWVNAVDHGKDMTALNAGVKGVDRLPSDIKFVWNYAGNCLTNQHGDVNYTHDVLVDESKCEFIVVYDTVLTDSAKYADILLPDAMRAEQLNMHTQGYSEWYLGVGLGGPAQEVPGECRSSYDVCADIAERFGKREEFTEGRTQEEWIRFLYEQGAQADGNMPTYDEMLKMGVYKRPLPPKVAFAEFRADPAANPLKTPSGKVEIYSEQLASIADTWDLGADERIFPIPVFQPGHHGYGAVTDEFPLYCCGFHHKSRTHSSFGFIEELEKVARQQLWINPIDAEPRGISTGDMLAVSSPAGEVRIEAKVTPRVVPGTVAFPQGAWHKADMSGDRVDHGACVNTLTQYRPTPLAKGNGTHSMIVQVERVR
ncbi:molybdopterin-dependent oxidoreductase [Eggerthellaceae bacterium zg-997]|nr:molybdopterin-dependent oxidoreductase [Eggerthellaceae bacterium zg-997]